VITSIELGARMPKADVIVALAATFEIAASDLTQGVPAVRLPPGLPAEAAAAGGATEESDRGGKSGEEPDIGDRLAVNLYVLRRKAGLSQRELSKISGVARTRISSFEARTRLPQLATLGKLADALGVPPSVLIDKALDDEGVP
jgi:transcriptional regulator with XRE-family HTH domain